MFSEATGLQLQEDRDPPKADGEALIAVRFAGICSTVRLIEGLFEGRDGVRKS